MAKKLFRSAYNYVPSKGEINDEPSLTVPNMVLSLEAQLNRVRNGIPLNFSPYQVYTGEDEPAPIFRDLTDTEMAQKYVEGVLLRLKEAKASQKAAEGKRKASEEVASN